MMTMGKKHCEKNGSGIIMPTERKKRKEKKKIAKKRTPVRDEITL